MDKYIHDSLKIWYEERSKDWPEQPEFEQLTMEQKAMWARSLSFSRWHLRQSVIAVFEPLINKVASFLKMFLNAR